MTSFPRDPENKQSAADLAYLWEEVAKRGWDPIGAFALIREESAWKTSIKNSIGATGLIQVTNSTARSMFGLPSAAPIADMSFRVQVDKIVLPYWDKMSTVKKYIGPVSFMLWGLGGGTAEKDPDGTQILYKAGTKAAQLNPSLLSAAGNISVGAVEKKFAPFVNMQKRAKWETYISPDSSSSSEEEKKKQSENCCSLRCPHCGGSFSVEVVE